MSDEYKNVGPHAENLASGRMLGPGETVELDGDAASDPHNAGLIKDGKLLLLEPESKKATTQKKEGEGT